MNIEESWEPAARHYRPLIVNPGDAEHLAAAGHMAHVAAIPTVEELRAGIDPSGAMLNSAPSHHTLVSESVQSAADAMMEFGRAVAMSAAGMVNEEPQNRAGRRKMERMMRKVRKISS